MDAMARPPAPRVRPTPRAEPARPRRDAGSRAVDVGRDDTGLDPAPDDDPDAYLDADVLDDQDAATADIGAELVVDDLWDDTAELDLLGGTGEYGASTGRPGAATARSARARVIDDAPSAARPTPEWRVALGDLGRGARVALEALVVSWLVVVVPVVAGYVATVTAPSLGGTSWSDAARSATSGWLLGLGEPFDVVTAATATTPEVVTHVTLVPLGLTALVMALLAGGVRRARIDSLPGVIGLLLAGGAVLWLAYTIAGTTPTSRAVLTQLGVAALALLLGMRSTFALLRPHDPRWREITGWVVAGVRAGAALLVGLVALGAALLLVTLLGSFGDVLAVHAALGPDLISTVVLVLAQAAALVTLLVWGVAWLAGPGFAIGAVSVSPVAATAGPLPALPVLALVPDAGPGPGRWVGVVVVVLALLVLVRPLGRTTGWVELATTAAVPVLVVALVGGAAAGLSGGEVGPLMPVGTSGPAVLLALALLTALGALLAVGAVVGLRALGRDPALLGEPVVRAAGSLRRTLRGWRRSVRRRVRRA